ncbi:hypothetical protein QTH91_09005 [Variovorax dokdonensis]|uniref:Tetratricopeptide repeat protein n=1 Tax=Variovorax dokdonensis TaxID=344883 RepID=A0ABT7N9K5_9BURK|nr:hypothetical protein [Variovorax dokdonensis]MDM0044617.1 hypothetical protein [Variovorax dokdonensis]
MSQVFTNGQPTAVRGQVSLTQAGGWLLLLAIAAACYWPGLSGTFVFDDDVNILQNGSLRIRDLSWSEGWAAAWSGHAGPLGRPVSLLTFALNYYFSGFDPFAFKLTNLMIHLANAVLVGALTQRLFLVLRERQAIAVTLTPGWLDQSAGCLVAALWVLHPLNLTGVLYVVQRMTSLSAFFGFVAVLAYTSYRARTFARTEVRRPLAYAITMGAIVLVGLTLSVLSKESGLLFAPLILWIETWVFRFRVNGRMAQLFGVDVSRCALAAVVVTAIYLMIFKLPQMLGPGAFANRDFTLIERGMTETRVLLFYLRMFVLPRNSELSLYHDDVEISHGLWDPPSTALSMVVLAAITLACWVFRKRFPELIFGWGWFLIAHALESTIFPLELVYEHRNYFATIGLLVIVPLAVRRAGEVRSRRLLVLLFAGYVGILGFVTYVRALQWSDPVDWIALEAGNHPRSPRANYDLARVYMVLRSQSGDDRFGVLADEALAKATQSYLPGVLPFIARMQLAYFRRIEPDAALAEKVLHGLKTWPYHNVTNSTLASVVACQVEMTCRMPDSLVLQLLTAPLQNRSLRIGDRAELIKLQAQYYINKLGDMATGEMLIRQSIDLVDSAPTRIMYAQCLAFQSKFGQGMIELEKAQAMDILGIYRRQIEVEREAMRHAQAE